MAKAPTKASRVAKLGPRSKPEDLLFHPDERFRLDVASPLPLYHQMESVILERLKAATDQSRSFPTEADLAQIFNVSRATVRKVSDALTQKGLIRRQRSLGTKIVSNGMSEDLGRLTSFSEQMAGQGLKVSTRILSAKVERPTKAVADRLKLGPAERVLSVRRLRGSSEVFPFVLLHSFLPASLGLRSDEDFNGSLYNLMETKYHLKIDWAEEEISAATANAEEASALNVRPGSTLLVMERLTFGPGNVPLEFVRASYIPTHYKFRARLRR